jgi:hypothetical protein
MERNTFAWTSARLYRIVDAEERILFNITLNFCGLKSIDINKANKLKNIRHNIESTFPHQKKRLQKENMLHSIFITSLVHCILITSFVH